MATKRPRMHTNSTKHPKTSISGPMGWIGCVRCKNSTQICGMNFWTNSARFASGFVWQSNGLECTQIVRNAPKCHFSVQWGGLGAFVEKNSDATSWHELLHYFGPFCTEFHRATKRSRIHPNSTKHTKISV